MNKEDFFDILFAGAYYSIFANIPVMAILMAISRYTPAPDDTYIVAMPIIAPIVMYNVCKYLYNRK